LLPLSNVYAQWFIDFETGIAFGSYNDVEVPRNVGTRFSLSDDLSLNSTAFYRIKFGYRIHDRHNLFLFAAPFSLDASGSLNRVISFNQEDFPADISLSAKISLIPIDLPIDLISCV
jgi:hypothetical protein